MSTNKLFVIKILSHHCRLQFVPLCHHHSPQKGRENAGKSSTRTLAPSSGLTDALLGLQSFFFLLLEMLQTTLKSLTLLPWPIWLKLPAFLLLLQRHLQQFDPRHLSLCLRLLQQPPQTIDSGESVRPHCWEGNGCRVELSMEPEGQGMPTPKEQWGWHCSL